MLHLIIWEEKDGTRAWDVYDDEFALSDRVSGLLNRGVARNRIDVAPIEDIKFVPLDTVLSWQEGGVS